MIPTTMRHRKEQRFMFDGFDVGWLIHGSLIGWVAVLVTGRPHRLVGTPERRARGWLGLGGVVACLGAPCLAYRGRPGLAVACLVLAGLALCVARTLWKRRPVGAVPVDMGDPVEARDGFVGRVVQVGPWDYAVTVQDVMGDRRVYATDEVRKIKR